MQRIALLVMKFGEKPKPSEAHGHESGHDV
jgi:hypothetical protein